MVRLGLNGVDGEPLDYFVEGGFNHRATSRTSWVTECPRTGRAPPPSSRASRSSRSA
jgi:hypothetical protein